MLGCDPAGLESRAPWLALLWCARAIRLRHQPEDIQLRHGGLRRDDPLCRSIGVRESLDKKRPTQALRQSGSYPWQRPTFPSVLSIIGSERLNDRVRDGNGCDPLDITARSESLYRRDSLLSLVAPRSGRSGTANCQALYKNVRGRTCVRITGPSQRIRHEESNW